MTAIDVWMQHPTLRFLDLGMSAFPMLDAGRALEGLGDLGLDAEARALFLRGNAERLRGLRG